MISICIIAIGDELLDGFTIDTNSQWIKEKFSNFNVDVKKSVVLPDSKETIIKELSFCLDEGYNYIFISGGLGPTHDDITKECLSDFFNIPLIVVDKHLLYLKKKFNYNKKNIDSKKLQGIENSIETQAKILKNSQPINNPIGTALGMTWEINKTRIFVLPGVPKELRCMIDEIVIPNYISSDRSLLIRTLRTTGITETRLFHLVEDIINKNKILKFSFLPHFTGVNIRISDKGDKKCFNNVISQVEKRLEHYCYGYDDDSIESVVANLLTMNRVSLSVAESCTGGLLSKKLTDISGSSYFFKGGVVAYSNDIKNTILNISSTLLDKEGAVSKEVALEMCRNVAENFKTDFGISITGISGPEGGTEKKPVGLYYIGVRYKDKFFSKKFIFNTNDRLLNREVSAFTALNLIRLTLEDTL